MSGKVVRLLECAPDGGQFAGWELTGAAGLWRIPASSGDIVVNPDLKSDRDHRPDPRLSGER
jgi:hypothetical protein